MDRSSLSAASATSNRGAGIVTGCLIGVMVALLVAGVVSHTPLRHLVQITPAVLVLGARLRRAEWSAMAALPIFLFWLFIMALIWLYLLGLAHVIKGHFSLAEIICTGVIGACSALGIVGSLREQSAQSLVSRLLIFAAFASLQVGAIWMSMGGALGNR